MSLTGFDITRTSFGMNGVALYLALPNTGFHVDILYDHER